MHRQEHKNRPHSRHKIREVYIAAAQDREQILQAPVTARGPAKRVLLWHGKCRQIPRFSTRAARPESGRAVQSVRSQVLCQDCVHDCHPAAAAH